MRASLIAVALLTLLHATLATKAEGQAPARAMPRVLEPSPLAVSAPDTYRKQRRARLLLAVGAGLLMSAAIHGSWAARSRRCAHGRRDREPLYVAGTLAGVGAALTIGGGTWLAFDGRAAAPRPSRGQRWAVVGAAFGSLLLSQSSLWSSWALDSLGCQLP